MHEAFLTVTNDVVSESLLKVILLWFSAFWACFEFSVTTRIHLKAVLDVNYFRHSDFLSFFLASSSFELGLHACYVDGILTM